MLARLVHDRAMVEQHCRAALMGVPARMVHGAVTLPIYRRDVRASERQQRRHSLVTWQKPGRRRNTVRL